LNASLFAASFGAADLSLLAVAAFFLLFLFVLVMTESAVGRTSTVRVDSLDKEAQARVAKVLDQPEAILNPLRFMIVFLLLAESTLVVLLADRWVSTPWVLLLGALNVCVVFVVAEAVPRTLGIIHAERAVILLAGPVVALVGNPLIRVIADALIGVANVIVPGKGLRRGPFARPEDLIAFAGVAVEDAVLDEDERDFIESVIEFGDTVVREVMVPRTDMTTIEVTSTVAEALLATSEAGFSRVPVVGDNIDDVVGLVYVKDLIRAELVDRAAETLKDFLRPAHFVPETKRVSELLKEMQKESFHMSVAVDEYGGIAGLVTLEDLIEELVGEIVDEYDVEEPLVERQLDGSLRVDARILIDELNDLAGLDLPEGDWDTVGGLVFDRFGRIPVAGEICVSDGYMLRVERVQGRRITKVLVRVAEQAEVASE
jgi:putative hemolysin